MWNPFVNNNDPDDDPIDRIKEEKASAWDEVSVGGLTVRISPNSSLSIYELTADDVMVSLANSVEQNWADLHVVMGPKANFQLSKHSLSNQSDISDDYVYLCIGMDEDTPGAYPLIEIKLHLAAALKLFGALLRLEGDIK